MGCLQSKSKEVQYQREVLAEGSSRDQPNDSTDDSNYVFENLDGGTVSKLPGQLCGEGFTIDNCKNANMYVFDHTSQVNIDDCKECHIFIGPCKGSVFLRNCTDCVIMLACQQLRTRDCHSCTVYLHCTSQPVIEQSVNMKFGCFHCNYPELENQFKASRLSFFNNNWSSVHDFTPEIGDNWSIIRSTDEVAKLRFQPDPEDDTLSQVAVTFEPSKSLIPNTQGDNDRSLGADRCLVTFFASPDNVHKALAFLEQLKSVAKVTCTVLYTKQFKISKDMMRVLFEGHPDPPTNPPEGDAIVLELLGPTIITDCADSLSADPSITANTVYCSPDKQQATKDIVNLRQLINGNYNM